MPSAGGFKTPNQIQSDRAFDGWWYRWQIVQIGSVWRNPNGNLNVPILNENDGRRNLNLNWFDNDWNPNYRFLAVRKSLHCALTCFIQPPSILPISFRYSEIKRNFLSGSALTSQLLVNIYMNELDQFVKHHLKVKYYIRYADDFVLLSEDCDWLKRQIPIIRDFLTSRLKLTLHPNKIYLKTLASGVDFLGWVHFFDHRVLRTTTKKRMVRKLRDDPKTSSSYLGMIKHGNTKKLKSKYFKSAKINP